MEKRRVRREKNGFGVLKNRAPSKLFFKWNFQLLFLLFFVFFYFHFQLVVYANSFDYRMLLIFLSVYYQFLLNLLLIKKCKALIIIIMPPLALYNINLPMNLNWEWRQIKHVIVKQHYIMIYGIYTFSPWTTAHPYNCPL